MGCRASRMEEARREDWCVHWSEQPGREIERNRTSMNEKWYVWRNLGRFENFEVEKQYIRYSIFVPSFFILFLAILLIYTI